jgi:SPP1 gp7 family putative phage head morphogenesis protein
VTEPGLPEQLRAFQQRQLANERSFIDAFLAWVARLLGVVTTDTIVEALELGIPYPVLNAMTGAGELDLGMLDAAAAEARHAATEVPPRLGLQAVFNVDDPFFQVAVEQAGATDIRAIEEETRQAVRDIVGMARRNGWHPYEFAPLVRDTVGLTRRQAVAVVNLYQGQVADVGNARAKKLADAYAGRLQTQRARTIARTETLKAANLGRIASFEQAANNGLYQRDRAQLEWIATLDERTCALCAALHGERTPVGSTFDGELPPRHPQCRCTVMLVLD